MPPTLTPERVRWSQRPSPFAWWCPVCRAGIRVGDPLWLAWTRSWGVGMHLACRIRWQPPRPPSDPVRLKPTDRLSLFVLPLLAAA